jgi:hypothetical protein
MWTLSRGTERTLFIALFRVGNMKHSVDYDTLRFYTIELMMNNDLEGGGLSVIEVLS